MKIVTHDGTFHADEVFATAVLKTVFPNAEFIRTRDVEILRSADIVYDAGLEFDGVSKFDHHQPIKELREDKTKAPYSSFGLIWRQFNHQFVKSVVSELNSERITEVVRNIDSKIVYGVDVADNGKSMGTTWDVTRIISSMNSLFVQGLPNDDSFSMAVDLAKTVLISQVSAESAEILAEQYVQAAYTSRTQKEILVLSSYCNWSKAVLEIDINSEVLFVIFPNNTNDGYRVMTVPVARGNYISRKLLPANWSGKTVDELNKIVGVKDAMFCHTDLFICGFESKGSAIKAAKLAIAEKEDLKFPTL